MKFVNATLSNARFILARGEMRDETETETEPEAERIDYMEAE